MSKDRAGGPTLTDVMLSEATGGELFGTIGSGKYIRPNLLLYMAVTYDNNK